jgi:amino acid transporter
VSTKIQIGLLVLIALSAAAAVYVSYLISRRQDIAPPARRAFLLSNVSLILCLASAVAGISIIPESRDWGLVLIAVSVLFLVIKFIFVRKFAHLLKSGQSRDQTRAVKPI